MPRPLRSIDLADVTRHCERVFAEPAADLIGLELEWPLRPIRAPKQRPQHATIAAWDGTIMSAQGRITFEPGGQVELSTAPAESACAVLAAATADADALRAGLEATGLEWWTAAIDDTRPPTRVLQRPRYAAMEAFFSASGQAGGWVMNNTAGTQINVSHAPDDPRRRWRLLHRIGPVLVAAFANSPGRDTNGQMWSSLRQGLWTGVDPRRTLPVRHDIDPATAWRDYALNADVMFVSAPDPGGGLGTGVPPGLTFGRWMTDGHELGWPTLDDFAYHQTTLFPPVRPRGWLELRFLDALPDWIREVAVLTVALSVAGDFAGDLNRLVPDNSDRWAVAARRGLDDPRLASAAASLFDLVRSNLAGITVEPGHQAMVNEFIGRYVKRRRTPGEDWARPADLRGALGPSEPWRQLPARCRRPVQ